MFHCRVECRGPASSCPRSHLGSSSHREVHGSPSRWGRSSSDALASRSAPPSPPSASRSRPHHRALSAACVSTSRRAAGRPTRRQRAQCSDNQDTSQVRGVDAALRPEARSRSTAPCWLSAPLALRAERRVLRASRALPIRGVPARGDGVNPHAAVELLDGGGDDGVARRRARPCTVTSSISRCRAPPR